MSDAPPDPGDTEGTGHAGDAHPDHAGPVAHEDKAEHDESTAVVGSAEADAMMTVQGDGKPRTAVDEPDGTDTAEHDEGHAAVGTPEADRMLVAHGDGKPEVAVDAPPETSHSYQADDHREIDGDRADHAGPVGQGDRAEQSDHRDDDGHGILAYGLEPGPRTHRILVYSSEPEVRDRVRGAVGRHPARDLGRVEWAEATTGKQVIAALDAGGLDLVLLDAESRPTGGLGLSKQLKDEITDCPPFVVLIARRDDAWLAKWSLADAVVAFPVDAPALTEVVAVQLRARESGLPVKRAYA